MWPSVFALYVLIKCVRLIGWLVFVVCLGSAQLDNAKHDPLAVRLRHFLRKKGVRYTQTPLYILSFWGGF